MTSIINHILTVILLTPLAGAIVILLVSSGRTSTIRRIANVFAAAGFLASVPLWFLYEPHGKTWQFAERGEWIRAIGASYYVGVDGFSILLILLTTLTVWMAMLASGNEIEQRVKQFYVCMLVLETALLGAFMALDFLLFFVFWEAVLVSVYLLIGISGGGRRRPSAIKFSIFMLPGSVVVLAGIVALSSYHHASTGIYSLDVTQFHTLALPVDLQRWVFLAFFGGFAVVLGMFPLHAWLPDAHTDAPSAGSVVLAAVMLKVGTYGFMRFSLPILPDASREFGPFIAAIAVAAVIYGAFVLIVQTDWKRLVAYSSVSQMGTVLLGMFALTPAGITGSMVQQINHGISIAALFLLVGFASDRGQSREIARYRGLSKAMPVFAAIYLVMTMSAVGVPALNGFIGQVMIVKGVSVVSRWWAAAAVVGLVIAAGSMLRVYQRTMFGGAGNPASAPFRDLTPRELATLVPLVALAIWIGLHPAPLLRRLETSAGRVVARANPVYAPVVAQGSDCATPAPPDPAGPPPAFVLVEPCAAGSDGDAKPHTTPQDHRR
jgi:NADH-quinone oxidoreductase subunit M